MRRWWLLSLLLPAVLPSKTDAWQIQKSSRPACASVTPDAWSGTYFFDTYVTVSGVGNLTSNVANAGLNNFVVEISNRCNSSGKYYFEFTTLTVNGSDLAFGLAKSTHDNRTSLGALHLTDGADSIGYQFFGTQKKWLFNGVYGSLVGLALPSNGDIIGIAVDLTNGLIWIRNVTVAPSTWYGSNTAAADPATGTNGFSFTPFGAAGVFPAWASNQNGSTNEGATLNAHGPFGAAAPTGFGPWQP